MVPSVVWLQHVFLSKSTFWIVPSVVWLLSAFCSKVFSFQNQQFGWFSSLFMVYSVVWLQCVFHSKSIFWVLPFTFHGSLSCLVPSVVWLQYVFHSKSTFWVVPFTFYGSQCCLAPKCCLLKLLNCWILTVRSCLDNIGLGIGIFNHLGGECLLFIH